MSCIVQNDTEIDLVQALLSNTEIQGCEECLEGKKTKLLVYFSDEAEAGRAAKIVNDQLPNTDLQITLIPPDDWLKEWRKTMKPAKLTEGIWASPDWLPPELAPDDLWIKIEPEMVFGTGHHESTQLASQCMVRLKEQIQNGWFLDVGTGSGILCFLAEKLGAAYSLGVELDISCLNNVITNWTQNRPGKLMQFVFGTTDCMKQGLFFDVIALNMIRTESLPLMDSCFRFLKPQGRCIWTGLISEDREKIKAYIQGSQWTVEREVELNDWIGFILEKRA
ncbi:MAG: 50S ribosomal protein L11 methyltransferase [Fibrobacteria bacterium]|nr:50S ribosomal protein L11 methyltransferase [Fibrobacteria bacterium]